MTAQDIKELYSMRDIVSRYGITINRSGFCSCPFHTGDRTPSLKVYKKDFHCHACGANGDIFTWVQYMDNLTFKEAYVSLGGEEEQSFLTKRKIEQAKARRKHEEYVRNKGKEELNRIIRYITAYRNVLTEFEPFTEEYVYVYNKLQYQIYLLEQWGDNNRTNKQSNG